MSKKQKPLSRTRKEVNCALECARQSVDCNQNGKSYGGEGKKIAVKVVAGRQLRGPAGGSEALAVVAVECETLAIEVLKMEIEDLKKEGLEFDREYGGPDATLVLK